MCFYAVDNRKIVATFAVFHNHDADKSPITGEAGEGRPRPALIYHS
jgi:hypothetical protein